MTDHKQPGDDSAQAREAETQQTPDAVEQTAADTIDEETTAGQDSDAPALEGEAALEPEPEPEPLEPEPEPEQDTPPAPAAKPKGRVLAFFALLLSLAALGGAGYLYYELLYLQPLAQVQSQGTELSSRQERLAADLSAQITALETATNDSLAALQSEQTERLASNEEAVLKSLNEALSAAPPSQREWKLAEAEYLLRIANHRVLMEQDSNGALILLQAADQIMAELDDFALHQVRARLADEIIALRQVPREDLQGIYLRLEAIKSQLNALPLPQPEYLQRTETLAAEQSVWETLVEELKKFVRIRTLSSSEALQPLLAPEEIHYLQLNLRLALEQAQLAALKRQQDVFEQSLLNVRRWLVDHADVEDERTTALLTSVDELLIIELARPLPDISGSLNELLTLRRGGS